MYSIKPLKSPQLTPDEYEISQISKICLTLEVNVCQNIMKINTKLETLYNNAALKSSWEVCIYQFKGSNYKVRCVHVIWSEQ